MARARVDTGGGDALTVIELAAGLRRLDDVARLLGRDRDTVARWLEEGRFPDAYRTPEGWWRVPLADVERVARAGGRA